MRKLGGRHAVRTMLGLVCVAVALILSVQGSQAAKNKATTFRLVRTEGDVIIKNSSDKELSQTADMRLYNGDHQITGEKSYAWMSLDDKKAVKLDENSESELRKKGRKLQILLDSGNLFFNVTVPLEKDESMNIRTSTMVTGVRGTCGWVEVTDEWTTRIYLLTGSLETVVMNPMDGNSETTTIKPGTYSDFLVYSKEARGQDGQSCSITGGSFSKDDIPGFVLVELLGDEGLIQKIYEESGIDLRGLTADEANARLKADQETSKEEAEKIRSAATKELSVVAKEPVWNTETAKAGDSIVYLVMPQKAATVQGYLDRQRVKKVVLLPGEGSEEDNTLKVDVAFHVPAEKMLEARAGVPVTVEKQYGFTIDGTSVIKEDLTNEGKLVVNSSNTLRVGGTLYNRGSLENTAAGRIVLGTSLVTEGDFVNAGRVEAEEGSNGDALILIKDGTLTMEDGEMVSSLRDAIIALDVGTDGVTLRLKGGLIANKREEAATLRLGGNFTAEYQGADVAGITDTLLGWNVDYAKYGLESIFRTDGMYHLNLLGDIDSYLVVLGEIAHGTVSVPGYVEAGAKVTARLVPDNGYLLESVSVHYFEGTGKPIGAAVAMAADHSFIMPDHDVTISAIFRERNGADSEEETLYKVETEPAEGGRITVSKTEALAGETITLIAIANESGELEGLTVTGEDGKTLGLSRKGNGYTFTMPEGNVKVTATFHVRKCDVVFYDEDGKTVLNRQTLDYGEVPVYAGIDPEKEATSQFTFEFAGWKSGAATFAPGAKLPALTGNVTYVATYQGKAVANVPTGPVTYTVNWVNWDGSVLKRIGGLSKGDEVVYDGDLPERKEDAQYTYTFKGWSGGGKFYDVEASFPEVTGNVVYAAQYDTTTKEYTVTWTDEGGAVLEVDEAVPYGTVPTYDGEAPIKKGNAQYDFVFSGWTTAVVAVTGDVTYVAAYDRKLKTYVVTWQDEDGTVIEVDEAVAYGSRPSYDTTPSKTGTAEFTYRFAAWTSGGVEYAPTVTLPAVTGNVTYKAKYDEIKNTYQVTWKNWDDSVIASASVEYGKTPVAPGYGSETFPLRSADASGRYSFSGWRNGKVLYTANDTLPAVTGGVTYVAEYSVTYVQYTVSFYNGEVLLASANYNYGETPVYGGDEPYLRSTAQYDYSFAGWRSGTGTVFSETLPVVTGDASYTAYFDEITRLYAISFALKKEDGGTVLYSNDFEYGSTPEYAGDEPSKASTDTVEYYLEGWGTVEGLLDELPAVMGTATYYAYFGSRPRTYGVTLNLNAAGDDSASINSGNVTEYVCGVGATLPRNVTRTGYRFDGWYESPEPKEGEMLIYQISNNDYGDKTYYAKWVAAEAPSHSITLNYDSEGGKVDVATSAKAGDVVNVSVYPNENCVLDHLTYTYGGNDGNVTSQIGLSNGVGSFTMPDGDVTVNVGFSGGA